MFYLEFPGHGWGRSAIAIASVTVNAVNNIAYFPVRQPCLLRCKLMRNALGTSYEVVNLIKKSHWDVLLQELGRTARKFFRDQSFMSKKMDSLSTGIAKYHYQL